MWTCIKCGAPVEDAYTICPQCSASKSAGRFGAVNPPRNASSYAAPVPPSPPPVEKPVPTAAPALQTVYTPDFSHVHSGRFLMIAGTLLSVMLPLVVLLLAWRQHTVLSGALLSLFFADPASLPGYVSLPIYVVLALLAALLSALPGFWTLGLGKALRRLHRMEELL